MTLSIPVVGIFAGAVEHRWPEKPPSAIGKQPVTGRVEIGEAGLTCDAQADLTVHGGPDKALHHYPADHYPAWSGELNREDLLPGAFGENLATTGLTEDTVCIGDVFTLGTAKVQISQGRQPCWKLNAHTGNSRMAWLFQKTGRTGWYYRILSTGTIQAGDIMTLTGRPHPAWTVRRVTAARLTRKVDPANAAELAVLPELADGWRAAFSKMAEGDSKENTRVRLQTP
ncbi:MOSC domain-containing protein [Leisingera daeponensis]|uniref:MOSC domain-containing protein n=1 Tax=Leisingera daeponensis TaxID=405746 RepID=A0ABS7NLZ7_9RHOB|nr:MOSC domain-containing protein [Leisingera daeponensis]MBY6142225.1 MOSC domain-containing protein [Leisingera daeponensis]